MSDTQNYQNHVRWFPLVHFVIFPMLAINLIWAIVCVFMEFDWHRVQFLLLSLGVVLVSLAARLQALRAQDTVIRLEERVRCKDVLSTELADKAHSLRTGQIIALRFASDHELSGLVERVLSGELKTNKEIKLAVQNWRSDHLRV